MAGRTPLEVAWRILLRIWLHALLLCSLPVPHRGALTGHHIYRPGKHAHSCDAADFEAGLWTKAAAPGGEAGSQLIGTTYAQTVIWQHQHPADCAAARYLIYQPCHQSGIGSNIHAMGLALSHALTMGRILMTTADHAHPFYDGEHCGPAGYYDCYFEPVSNCTHDDMAALVGGAVVHADLPVMLRPQDDAPGAPVGLWLCNAAEQRAYPPVLADFLETSPVHPSKRFYWWRAQSAAYLVRPNARTLADIAARKAQIFPQGAVARGTISVHVWNGGKRAKTSHADNERYQRAAEALLAGGAAARDGLAPSIFLSTEDPSALAFFQGLTRWEVSFTAVPRKPDARRNATERLAWVGPASEMLNGLVSLDLALACDAWVGTLTSNWCRLIDELRSTVRCKADRVYLDVLLEDPPAWTPLAWKSPPNLDWVLLLCSCTLLGCLFCGSFHVIVALSHAV